MPTLTIPDGSWRALFTLQGKSERIKNFPYPRHFATLNHYFMWVFVMLLPFALVPQFGEIGGQLVKILADSVLDKAAIRKHKLGQRLKSRL